MKTIDYSLSKDFLSLLTSSSSSSSSLSNSYSSSCWVLRPPQDETTSVRSTQNTCKPTSKPTNIHHNPPYDSSNTALLEEITLLLQRSNIVCGIVETTTVPSLSMLYSDSYQSLDHDRNSVNKVQYTKYLIIFSTNPSSRILPILQSIVANIIAHTTNNGDKADTSSSASASIVDDSFRTTKSSVPKQTKQYSTVNIVDKPTTLLSTTSSSYTFTETNLPSDINMDEFFTNCLHNYLNDQMMKNNWSLIGNGNTQGNLFIYGIQTVNTESNNSKSSTNLLSCSASPLSKYSRENGISIHDAVHLSIMIDQQNNNNANSSVSSLSTPKQSSSWKVRMRIEPIVFRLRHVTPELLISRDKFTLSPAPSTGGTTSVIISSTPVVPLPLQTKGDIESLHIYTLPSLVPATIESIDYVNYDITSRLLQRYRLLGYEISSITETTTIPTAKVLTSSKALRSILHSRTVSGTGTLNEENSHSSSSNDESLDTEGDNSNDYSSQLSLLPRTSIPLALCIADIIPLRWLSRVRENIIIRNIEELFSSPNSSRISSGNENNQIGYVPCLLDKTKCPLSTVTNNVYTVDTLPRSMDGTIPLLECDLTEAYVPPVADTVVTSLVTEPEVLASSSSLPLPNDSDDAVTNHPITVNIKEGKFTTSLFTSALSVLRKTNSTVFPSTVMNSTVSSILLTPSHTNTNSHNTNTEGPSKLPFKTPVYPPSNENISLPSTLCKPSPIILASSSASSVRPTEPIVKLPQGKKVGFTFVSAGKTLYQRVPNNTVSRKDSEDTYSSRDTEEDNTTTLTTATSSVITMNPFMLWLCALFPSDLTVTWSATDPLHRSRYLDTATLFSRISPVNDRELVSLPVQYSSIGKYFNLSLSDTILHPNVYTPFTGPYQSTLLTGNVSHLSKLSNQFESLIHIRQRFSPYPFVIREDTEADRQREKEEKALRYGTIDDDNYNSKEETFILHGKNNHHPHHTTTIKGTNLLGEFNNVDIVDNSNHDDEDTNTKSSYGGTKTTSAATSGSKRKLPKEKEDKPSKPRTKTMKTSGNGTTFHVPTVPDGTGTTFVPSVVDTTEVENPNDLANRIIQIGTNEILLRNTSYKQGGCELKHLKAYLRIIANAPVTGNKNQLVDRVLEYMHRNGGTTATTVIMKDTRMNTLV